MARVPDGVTEEGHEDLHRVARSVLLDGLGALREHADAVTIVGAQAIYLRSADVDLTVPAFTTDADFSIDPAVLTSAPLLEEAMTEAGFVRRQANQPGLWCKTEIVGGVPANIGVDLMVGAAFAGSGERSVRIPPHDKMAGRRTAGLEAAAVDADLLEIASLDPSNDQRVIQARTAGPAALLVAKGYKVGERVTAGKQERIVDKDAGDIIRLMLATEADETAGRFNALLLDDRVASVAAQGLKYLRELFGGERTPGTQMASRALAGDPRQSQVWAIAQSYLIDLPETS